MIGREIVESYVYLHGTKESGIALIYQIYGEKSSENRDASYPAYSG
jgi:hypothetical protein